MKYRLPATTVDIVVLTRDRKDILLIRRKNSPFQGHFALPGGFINYGEETLEQAACRELKEETGLTTHPGYLELVTIRSHPRRDPRQHTIAHVYWARKWEGNPLSGDDAAVVQWVSLKNIPLAKLAFDHNKILEEFEEWMEERKGTRH